MFIYDYFKRVAKLNPEAFSFYHVFAVVCIISITALFMKWTFKRLKWMRALEQFPGPPGHWLLGHVPELQKDGKYLQKIVSYGEKYPYAFPLQMGPDNIYLFIHHPSYVKSILNTTEPKDDIAYTFLVPWIGCLRCELEKEIAKRLTRSLSKSEFASDKLQRPDEKLLHITLMMRKFGSGREARGQGLLVSSGQKWFNHRRLLTPAFHYDVLKPYVKLMAESVNVMLDKWEVHAGTDQSFELFQHVSLMTLDSIMKCAFSCHSNCQTESGTNPYIKAVYEICDLVHVRFRVFPYHISNDIIFHLSPHGFRYRKACKIAHDHTNEVIRQRKEALAKEKEQGNNQKKRYLDFLDILICARDEQQQGLSDEAMQAEVDTFMFEGHDTTASGISWIFYSLACNPEHQQKCREEIQQVLNGKDTIEWDDLSKLPYTTMCIKESLRMYPPVTGIGRRLTKPITFFDGRTAPAGCIIRANIYAIHHNATVWENPEVFDPLRFLPENNDKRLPHAFVPFAAGPRNCIGQNFAMNEMKVAVALTLRKYIFTIDPEKMPKMFTRLVLRSTNGMHLKINFVENES